MAVRRGIPMKPRRCSELENTTMPMNQSQIWLWFIGMVVFSSSLHRLGFMGMPRRTAIGASAYVQPEWRAVLPLVGIGGTLLFVSGLLYFLNLVLTVWR